MVKDIEWWYPFFVALVERNWFGWHVFSNRTVPYVTPLVKLPVFSLLSCERLKYWPIWIRCLVSRKLIPLDYFFSENFFELTFFYLIYTWYSNINKHLVKVKVYIWSCFSKQKFYTYLQKIYTLLNWSKYLRLF